MAVPVHQLGVAAVLGRNARGDKDCFRCSRVTDRFCRETVGRMGLAVQLAVKRWKIALETQMDGEKS